MQNVRNVLFFVVLMLSMASFVLRDDGVDNGEGKPSMTAVNGFEFEADLSILNGIQSPDPNGAILMNGNFSDVAADAAPASNGGLLVVGFRTVECQLNSTRKVGIITHLDANGMVLTVHSSGLYEPPNDNTTLLDDSSLGDVENYRGFYAIEYLGVVNGERTYIVAGAAPGNSAGVFYFTEDGNVTGIDHVNDIAPNQSGSASGISPTSDGGFIVACNETGSEATFLVKLCADLSTQWVSEPEFDANTNQHSIYSKHVVEITLDNDGDGVGDQPAYATGGENGSGFGIYLTVWDDPAFGEDCNFSLANAHTSLAHAVYREGLFNPCILDAGTKAKSIALNFAEDQIGIAGIDENDGGAFLLITLDLPLAVENGEVQLDQFTYDTYPNNRVLSDCQTTTSSANYAQVIMGHSSGEWIMAGRSSVQQIALGPNDDFKASTEMSLLRVDANRNRIGNYEFFGDPHRRWGDVGLGLTELELTDDIAIVGLTRTEICWNILGEGAFDGNPCSTNGNGNGFPNNCPTPPTDEPTWSCITCCEDEINLNNCYQEQKKVSRSADTYVVCHAINAMQNIVATIVDESPCLAATVTGGTAPYSYAWDLGGIPTTQKICDLAAGTYCVTVVDGNCEMDTDCFTIEGTPACPNPAFPDFGVGANGSNPTTNGGTDGTLHALYFNSDAACANCPVVIEWSNGATTQQVTGVSAGTYCVTVTDECGACDFDCITLDDPTAGPCPHPDYPAFGVGANGSNPTTAGGSDGSLYALYFNSTEDCKDGPVVIEWSNGATTQQVTGVSAGTYCVTVTDECGACDSDCKTLMDPERPACPHPDYPSFGVGANGSNPTTAGGSDGSLYALYFNSTEDCKDGPVTIEWSNGATTPQVTGVSAGTYCVTVTDECGACDSDCKTLTDPGHGGGGKTAEKLAAPDQLLMDDIQLYPNPSNGQVTIVLPQAERRELEIFNAMGQRVLQKQNIQENYFEINLSQLSAGVYWVNFKINDQIESRKLVLLE